MKPIVPVESKPLILIKSASKFNANLQCGDCFHYRGSRHPNFDKPCSLLGVGTKSEAPSCYTPDVTAFKTLSLDAFGMLAALVASMTPRQSRVLMGILKYAGSLEKHDMTFLQEVYFCAGNEQDAYLDDYFKGYVLGVGKSGEFIVVGTDYLQSAKNSTFAYLSRESVLTEEQFVRRRKKLAVHGRLGKPKTVKAVNNNTYVVPTIDEAPTGEKVTSARKKKLSKADLTIET